jgi:hypothetical protein
LRFDRQTGSTAAGAGEVEWTTLAPRLALTFSLVDSRLLLRASWGRFAQQLRGETIARVDPAAAGEALFRFTDANGDGFWQEDEAAALVAADGFARPHVNDPGLRPAITEELLVAGEWAVRPGLVVAIHLSRRRHTDVHELRDLVSAGGEIRAAGAEDYVFDHFVNGTLPGGGSYSVPVFSLRPGIEDAGAALLTNGDRELVYDGVVLSLEKRLYRGFMARAHVHYGKSRWRLGEDYDRHHDPTDLAGSGDDDGALYVAPPADVDTGSARWLQSTWSGHLSGLVQIAPDRLWGFEVAAGVNVRQGYPLPYFVYDLGSADGLPRRVQVTEDVDTFRLDDVVTVDLRLAKEFKLPGELRLTFSADAFNLFDERVAVGREVNLSGVRGGWIEETLAARALRLGLRLSWR